MNAESFATYLKNPSQLHQINYQELKSLALQYPYCQSLHSLLLQKSKMDGHRDAEANLKKAATLSADRSLLYKKMKAIASPQGVGMDFMLVDDVLELPTLSNFRRPEPILIEKTLPSLPENQVNALKETFIKPMFAKDEDALDMSKLQVPPSPIELPDIQPERGIAEPFITPEMPQPADPDPIQPSQTPEIPNPIDPAPFLPDEPRQNEEFEKKVSSVVEWEVVPQRAPDSEVAKPPTSSRARLYQPPVLKLKPMPTPLPAKTTEEQVTMIAEKSITERLELVSETLAAILSRQGHREKAIKMYEQLILKMPEKNAYFAAQIQKLKQI